MSSIFGTSDQNSDYFSNYFNTSNNAGSAGLFGNTTSFLGDYSMIQSGVYKKLLTSYYKTQDAGSKGNTSSTANSTEASDSTGKLLNVRSDAGALKDAVDALRSSSLYQPTGKDENGKDLYDREKVEKNVKQFVEAYNSYMDSAGSVDSVGILNKTLGITKKTAGNQTLLKEIGITIGKDNKLVLDEEKLSEARLTTISSLFEGAGSFGDSLGVKASESYKIANSNAYANTHASSYTYNGAYSLLGTTNGIVNKYL